VIASKSGTQLALQSLRRAFIHPPLFYGKTVDSNSSATGSDYKAPCVGVCTERSNHRGRVGARSRSLSLVHGISGPLHAVTRILPCTYPECELRMNQPSPRSVGDMLVRQNVPFATASSKTVTPEVEDALCSVIAFINQSEE
jgi:hypothetical protein